jgi:chromosome transmission fidelity protein 1
MHSLDIDTVNLFKLLAYLKNSRLSQKLQGFTERVVSSSAAAPLTTVKKHDNVRFKGGASRNNGRSVKAESSVAVEGDIVGGSDVAFVPKHVPALMQVQAFLECLLHPGVDGRVGVLLAGNPYPSQRKKKLSSLLCLLIYVQIYETEPPAPPALKYLLLNPTDVFAPIATETRATILAGGESYKIYVIHLSTS